MKQMFDFFNCYSVPVQKLRFSPNNNSIKVMRDDLYPVAFGGNKARKAEIFFDDILKSGADTVVTYGSSSSNHCRAVSCLCSQYNLECVVVSPSEQHHKTSNLMMSEIFGSKTVECSVNDVEKVIEYTLSELKSAGKKPYFVYGGGHGNLGTLAYKKVFDEILRVEKITKTHFDYIFHASGTGTTQAGLIAGNIQNNSDIKIVGISIARKNPRGKDVVINSVKDFLNTDNIQEIIDKTEFIDDYVGDGYGAYTGEQISLMKKMLIEEGIPLDHTYTGKAFYGMTEYIKEHNICDKNILFIHTGGTPLFYDDLEKLL